MKPMLLCQYGNCQVTGQAGVMISLTFGRPSDRRRARFCSYECLRAWAEDHHDLCQRGAAPHHAGDQLTRIEKFPKGKGVRQ